jgi:DNA-binding beta-propeller fold protein YncE
MIDPVSGARSTFLDGTAYAPARTLRINDVAVSADGANLYFIDDRDATVHHVDVATGTPSVILDPATTAGFPLGRPKHLAEGPVAGVLFVTDTDYDGIFAVDATTGESVLIVR